MSTPTTPLLSQPLPLLTRTGYYLALISLQRISNFTFYLKENLTTPPAGTAPTLKKSYPVTPHLVHRIFYPPSYTPSSPPLPLLINLHGGGFVFGTPALDDPLSSRLSREWNVLVIALDYPKAPATPYPVPTQQVAQTIHAIVADTTLPFDRSRVVLGGSSAGGQLALSASLDPSLADKINGILAFVPVTDFSVRPAVKKHTRPYRDEKEVDSLMRIIYPLEYAYVRPGTDLKEPGLSPAYAERRDLPEWICTVGAEKDILCCEAGAMMGRLAGKKLVIVGDVEGGNVTEGLDPDVIDGFEAEDGKLKWLRVSGATHGFISGWGDDLTKRQQTDTINLLKEWLYRGPFKAKISDV